MPRAILWPANLPAAYVAKRSRPCREIQHVPANPHRPGSVRLLRPVLAASGRAAEESQEWRPPYDDVASNCDDRVFNCQIPRVAAGPDRAAMARSPAGAGHGALPSHMTGGDVRRRASLQNSFSHCRAVVVVGVGGFILNWYLQDLSRPFHRDRLRRSLAQRQECPTPFSAAAMPTSPTIRRRPGRSSRRRPRLIAQRDRSFTEALTGSQQRNPQDRMVHRSSFTNPDGRPQEPSSTPRRRAQGPDLAKKSVDELWPHPVDTKADVQELTEFYVPKIREDCNGDHQVPGRAGVAAQKRPAPE